MATVHLLKLTKRRETKGEMKQKENQWKQGAISFRERERLLSKNTGDPTVSNLRDKKESCSMRKGLRVGTRFKEFRQTP